jgi:hypothetical protein
MPLLVLPVNFTGAKMPRYYFILQWDSREHDDPHGTALPNDQAARDYAERIIRELKEAGGYDDEDLAMVVKNAADRIVFSIPFLHTGPAPTDHSN